MIIAASASCAQYANHCPTHDLPMTGYPLIIVAILALVLLVAGLIGLMRSRDRS